MLFQYILKAGNTYQGVVNRDKPDELLNTKINRVFASHNGIQILKKRQDGGLVKFANTPDEMYLWNDDLDKFIDFKNVIDKQWYYNLTMKNLKRWC